MQILYVKLAMTNFSRKEKENKMEQTIYVGEMYHFYLQNKIHWEGEFVARDETFIRMIDKRTGRPIIFPILIVVNIIGVNAE